jgi:hypothetical protein
VRIDPADERRKCALARATHPRLAFQRLVEPRTLGRVTHSWTFRCKLLMSNDRILAQLGKFSWNINARRMSLNQRVQGSSPGAPTKQEPLFFKRLREWSPRTERVSCDVFCGRTSRAVRRVDAKMRFGR